MPCTITTTEFKDFFDRGQFDFGAILPEVRDKDITEAINETLAVFNQDLLPDEASCKQALKYLTAHFLQLDLEMADGGGQPSFLQTSRSADGISESVHIPEWMKEDDFALYATTAYGVKYLTLMKPYLDGVITSVAGGTKF